MDSILTVAQFNEVVNIHVQSLGVVSVVGEITEKRISRNSGLMITLKDEKENSILKIGGFAPRVKGVNSVDVGMKVVVVGVPQIYGPLAMFTLQAVSLTPYGEGALKAAFEKLKMVLEGKGYFAEERKRPLPEFITKIALITAEDSAAYIDFMKILNESNTGLDIDFYSVHVQGKYAVEEIIRAINKAGKSGVDVIVLTRGGGSLEDLIAFNDEQVAEAVFASGVPVISAVGHERDTSISDLVADVVASTPSQAAYYIAAQNQNFINSLVEKLDICDDKVTSGLSGLDYYNALYMVEQIILKKINQFNYQDKMTIIEQHINAGISAYKYKTGNISSLLDSLDPRKVLQRGYAILRTDKGSVKSIKEVKAGESLKVRLVDGSLKAKIEEIYNS